MRLLLVVDDAGLGGEIRAAFDAACPLLEWSEASSRHGALAELNGVNDIGEHAAPDLVLIVPGGSLRDDVGSILEAMRGDADLESIPALLVLYGAPDRELRRSRRRGASACVTLPRAAGERQEFAEDVLRFWSRAVEARDGVTRPTRIV